MDTLTKHLRRLLYLMAMLPLMLLLASPPVLAQEQGGEGWSAQGEIGQAVGGVTTDTWRQVKSGEDFIDSRADSTYNLINPSGEYWRQVRNRWISPGGLIAIGGMLVVLVIFYLIMGQKKLDDPRTGRKLLRWTAVERAMHWTLASLFIALALTGLNLMYGKFVFQPLFGNGFWAPMISGTKVVHNYLGPLFGIMLILVLAKFLTVNLPKKHDWTWFKKGGGMFGKAHPDAGFANGGEKGWYWLLATVGLLVVVSGLVLDFPNFNQSRDTMQWANIIHGIGSLGLVAVALGHIYIGTLGTEGAFEGMKTGYVDETWAKQHHNLWYEDVKDKATQPPDVDSKAADDDTATAERPN